ADKLDDEILLLNKLQSAAARHPACEPLAVKHESELPAKERPEPIDAEVTAPVPLPLNKPPSVVLPVPPKPTERVVVETILPFASVVRRAERRKMLISPLALMAKAAPVDVASAVEVAMYKLLLIARKLHRLLVALLSVNNNCGAVEEPIVTAPKSGVEVPIPTYVPVSMTDELANENVVPFHFAR
ncbi:MAG: hypothetical protein AAB562_02665, partial [Patescibacteria group bacterium]